MEMQYIHWKWDGWWRKVTRRVLGIGCESKTNTVTTFRRSFYSDGCPRGSAYGWSKLLPVAPYRPLTLVEFYVTLIFRCRFVLTHLTLLLLKLYSFLFPIGLCGAWVASINCSCSPPLSTTWWRHAEKCGCTHYHVRDYMEESGQLHPVAKSWWKNSYWRLGGLLNWSELGGGGLGLLPLPGIEPPFPNHLARSVFTLDPPMC